MKSESHETDPASSFIPLIMSCQRDLKNYIFSLHPHAEDLDDLFQETSLKLWNVFSEYDAQRPFLPWALRIAYFQVLKFRKDRSRDRLVFSDELVELLAGEAPLQQQGDVMSTVLNDCLDKLTPRAREVLLSRYSQKTNIAALAETSRQSVHALYRLLEKSRIQVVSCMKQQLESQGYRSLPGQ
jgi:RNA polymerase sigma-70 factor (ECF subfamily)